VAVERRAQRGAAGLAAAQHGLDLVQGHELQVLRLGQRTAQLGEAHLPCDVEQRLGGSGNRKVTVPGALEVLGPMHAYVFE
jgi:hypothetical protein